MELAVKFSEQCFFVFIAVVMAMLLGVLFGILGAKYKSLQKILLTLANLIQTIPSLALLALLLPIFGIGIVPAIFALTLYALLPILANTIAGLSAIPQQYSRTATLLGLSAWKRLRFIELPLALPTMLTGLRTSVVWCVAIATLAAFIGAGGLGDFINQGLALNNKKLLLLGAIPSALMALGLDYLVATVQRHYARWQRINQPDTYVARLWSVVAIMVSSIIAMVFLSGVGFYVYQHLFSQPDTPRITIGSKNFTEQMILAEIIAQHLERTTTYKIQRRFNLGSIHIVHHAIVRGDIDIYPEYTGTAYRTILKKNDVPSAKATFAAVAKFYQQNFELHWLPPLGFNNTQALAMRAEDAIRYGIHTISELSRRSQYLIAGFPPEFFGRKDGWDGLAQRYKPFSFDTLRRIEIALSYDALKARHVDVIAAFTTDGRLIDRSIYLLRDDRKVFPAYEAAIVVRQHTLQQCPKLAAALQQLSGKINNQTMQRLNYAVEVQKQEPRAVATAFLAEVSTTPHN